MSKLQNVISCTRRSPLLSKIQQEYTIRNFDNRNTVCIGPRELIIRIDEIERYDSTYCTYITPLNQAHVFGDEVQYFLE